MPERSPSPPKVITDSMRIGAEEDVDEFEGMTEQEVQEIVSQREAKANAQILEMVGDIPDADGKPPENVLFVCKLNPVTTAEDLEIIFSRFGPILSCEVIKDQKTGDSLQYAFIEFENEEDCVSAYFKMDNVLIDDRRIHVDFSQSMAKVKGIRKRTASEEQPTSPADDGLVSTKKDHKKDGYEMVFDNPDVPHGAEKMKDTKRRRHESDSDSERQRSGHRSHREKEKRDGRDTRRRRDDSEEDVHRDRRRREKGREKRRDEGRERDKERYRRRETDERRHRYRERSRSRERHQYSRGRSRSRSRERHRRH